MARTSKPKQQKTLAQPLYEAATKSGHRQLAVHTGGSAEWRF